MENKKSMFQATLSSIIAGIIVAMIVYFGLNFSGFSEYRAIAKLSTSSVENLDQSNSADSFVATINSNSIKERTLDNLKIDWPLSKLDTRLKIKAVENSTMIELQVDDTNKLRAEDLADEYADLTVTVINNIYNTGANVIQYAYGNARTIDNTPRYALFAGLAGFILYLLGSFVTVKRHNLKLEKNNKVDEQVYQQELKKAQDQVQKNKEEIEKESYNLYNDNNGLAEEISNDNSSEDLAVKEKDKGTRPLDNKDYDDYDEPYQATRKIDAKDVAISRAARAIEEENGKLEVVGKLPPYKRGDLDV